MRLGAHVPNQKPVGGGRKSADKGPVRAAAPSVMGRHATYTVVGGLAVALYVNSLRGEFVHDDVPAIVRNNDVTGQTPLHRLLVDDFWGTPMSDPFSHKSYRPLTTLTFRAICTVKD
ncbi:protein O-mannosyl-transferase TMTC3-like [Nilaparvata lugens]|uniref:protein O-mannosyl-transferase TMTC3-like n=1 Tax=Nilaparvata lugens TaxID=108931 RepID=UPI00193D3323|nr:protein O-mannosyl-transferase TMTC3-like [Nilaparvata lugens]